VPVLTDLPRLLEIAERAESDGAGYEELKWLLQAGSSLGAEGACSRRCWPHRHRQVPQSKLKHLECHGMGKWRSTWHVTPASLR
jgi:hypothetical protein